MEGYRAAMADAGLAVPEDYLGIDTSEVIGRHSIANARELTQRMIALQAPPTGFVTASDTHAFGVMQAGRELGLGVPDDLSVVGYDNTDTGLIAAAKPCKRTNA
jgi:LacI family transcriptional regulator